MNNRFNLNKRLALGLICLVLSVVLVSCSSNKASVTPTTKPKPILPIVDSPILVAHTTDGTVSYRVDGNGPSLVLIMGYSGSMDAWMPTFVDTLAQTHRVVIVDNAGIGQTSLPSGTLTMGKMAAQTNALIQYLKLNKPDVLGWSMGGMIAQALAINYPQDVNHLILAATLPGNGHAAAPTGSAITALTSPSSNNIVALLNLLFPPNQKIWQEKFVEGISKYPHFYVATSSVDAMQFNALANWAFAKDRSGLDIKKIKAKTLIADGTEDQLIPQSNDKYLHSAIKGSKLVFYPDAGHGFLFQDQNQFVPLINNFLKSS